MIMLAGSVRGQGRKFFFREGADRVLKPPPDWYGRMFLLLGWRESPLLFLRIEGIERLADDLVRRPVARFGHFLPNTCVQVGRKGECHWGNVSLRGFIVEQRFRLLQVHCIKPLGEPVINLR